MITHYVGRKHAENGFVYDEKRPFGEKQYNTQRENITSRRQVSTKKVQETEYFHTKMRERKK